MAASDVAICNRALQLLGAKRIVSLAENSKSGRACNVAYGPVRKAELRDRVWNFSKKRVVLAPDATAPAFDYDYQFTLPPDCLYPIIKDNDDNWIVEGRKLLTNDGDTLYLNYVSDITDTTLFDPLFSEALSKRIAVEMCEEITQSNTKREALETQYDKAIARARNRNAFEKQSQEAPEDPWITARI